MSNPCPICGKARAIRNRATRPPKTCASVECAKALAKQNLDVEGKRIKQEEAHRNRVAMMPTRDLVTVEWRDCFASQNLVIPSERLWTEARPSRSSHGSSMGWAGE